ncbi:MAG: hypothetical protein RBT59_00955 [Arcobacteraceae bacterium]|jgi:hypothetical protein|nr:hypothetical protein [Arcobacteraceae bacterium]
MGKFLITRKAGFLERECKAQEPADKKIKEEKIIEMSVKRKKPIQASFLLATNKTLQDIKKEITFL